MPSPKKPVRVIASAASKSITLCFRIIWIVRYARIPTTAAPSVNITELRTENNMNAMTTPG